MFNYVSVDPPIVLLCRQRSVGMDAQRIFPVTLVYYLSLESTDNMIVHPYLASSAVIHLPFSSHRGRFLYCIPSFHKCSSCVNESVICDLETLNMLSSSFSKLICHYHISCRDCPEDARDIDEVLSSRWFRSGEPSFNVQPFRGVTP